MVGVRGRICAKLDQPASLRHTAAVMRSEDPHAGHVALPALAISGLSVVLVVGLELLGVLQRLNSLIAQAVSRDGAETFSKALPSSWIWISVVILSFGMAYAILGTPGQLGRWLLWLSAALLVAGWAPVLSLAAHRPDVAAPWIATVWSGICSLVYASRYATDDSNTPPVGDGR